MNRLMMVFAMALLVAVKCTQTPVAGGGASETVAMVEPWNTGCRILIADDSGGVRASICHELYSPDPADPGRYLETKLFEGSDRAWDVPVLPESTYHIIVIDTVRGTAALFLFDNRAGSRSAPQSGKLKPAGTLSGLVTLVSSGNSSSLATGFTVYLRGTPLSAVTDSDGGYRIGWIPKGIYPIGAFAANVRSWSNGSKTTIVITGDSLYIQNLTLSTTN